MKLLSLFILIFSSAASAKSYDFIFWGYKFKLELPQTYSESLDLVVLFHGCKQDAMIINQGTLFAEKAATKKIATLIPEQNLSANADHCWNWFHGMNQQRSMGELRLVKEAIDYAKVLFQFNINTISSVGLSSGGVTALGFGYCYRELVSLVAVHSGLAFASADNASEANRILLDPSLVDRQNLGEWAFNCADVAPNRLKQFLIFHGRQDSRVDSNHSYLIRDQILQFYDLMDDMRLNESVIYSTRVLEVNDTHYPYRIETNMNHDFKINNYFIEQLGHAWSGGNPITPQFDSKGPDATSIILDKI